MSKTTRKLTWDANKIYLDDKVIHDFSHYRSPDIRKSMIAEAVTQLQEVGDSRGNPVWIPAGYIRGAGRGD